MTLENTRRDKVLSNFGEQFNLDGLYVSVFYRECSERWKTIDVPYTKGEHVVKQILMCECKYKTEPDQTVGYISKIKDAYNYFKENDLNFELEDEMFAESKKWTDIYPVLSFSKWAKHLFTKIHKISLPPIGTVGFTYHGTLENGRYGALELIGELGGNETGTDYNAIFYYENYVNNIWC